MKKNDITNSDIFIIAVHKVGGAEKYVDIEDAYVACLEIAPQRFSWRTKKDLPDREKCYKALAHTDNRDPYPLIRKGEYMVRLSKYGIQWMNENESLIASISKNGSNKVEFRNNRSSNNLNHLKKSFVFQQWLVSPEQTIEKWRLAEALICLSHSANEEYRKRIEALLADAELSKDQKVESFINQLLDQYSSWF